MCSGSGFLRQASLSAGFIYRLFLLQFTLTVYSQYAMEKYPTHIKTGKISSQPLLPRFSLTGSERQMIPTAAAVAVAPNRTDLGNKKAQACKRRAAAADSRGKISTLSSPGRARLLRNGVSTLTIVDHLSGRYRTLRQSSSQFRRLISAAHTTGIHLTAREGLSRPPLHSRRAQAHPYRAPTVFPSFPDTHQPTRKEQHLFPYDSPFNSQPSTDEWKMHQSATPALPVQFKEASLRTSSSHQNTAVAAPLGLTARIPRGTTSYNTTQQELEEYSAFWTSIPFVLQEKGHLNVVPYPSGLKGFMLPPNHEHLVLGTESTQGAGVLSSSPLSSSLESVMDIDQVPWDLSFVRPGEDTFFPGQYETPSVPLYKTNATALLSSRQQRRRSADGEHSDVGVAQTRNGALAALATYYKQLGDIDKMLQYVGNVTTTLKDKIGMDTITNSFQTALSPQMREQIVAMTPPYIFGRVQNVFWGAVSAGWNAWVDSWAEFVENPPAPIGVKLQETREWIRLFNQFTVWLHWAPFILTDTIQTAATNYVDIWMTTKDAAYRRRDRLLLSLLEKQLLTYAPVFHVAIIATQHIDHFKEKGFDRIDNVTAPLTNTVLIAKQFLDNMRDFGDIGYGVLQLCALNPVCCANPSRCYPLGEQNLNKFIDLTPGVIGF